MRTSYMSTAAASAELTSVPVGFLASMANGENETKRNERKKTQLPTDHIERQKKVKLDFRIRFRISVGTGERTVELYGFMKTGKNKQMNQL